MRFKQLAILGALISSATSIAVAQQTTTATLTAPNAPYSTAVVSPYGYYMSPYAGTVGSETGVRLNCVDFFHEAYINQPWTVFNTSISALSAAVAQNDLSLLQYTRWGASGLYSASEVVEIYKQVAWLTDQYGADPGGAAARTSAIQTAIWAIANDRGPERFSTTNQWMGTLGPSANINETGYWISAAKAAYSQQSSDYYDKFYILTDQTIKTQNNWDSGRQEFVYSATPEPGTLILIGTGMAALARMRRRRSSSLQEAVSA
jgi:hypothetical protein